MEEQKKNKEVKMSVVEDNKKQPKKYSYEELNKIAEQLFNENRYLKQELHKASEAFRMYNRLDYLFRVIELAQSDGCYKFSSDFVTKCILEVQDAMTIPEETEESKEN